MKQKWVDAYMDVAERFAQLSSAVRLKVGSVIVKDHRIVSIGYNGTPAGWDNDCEVKQWCSGGGWLSPGEIEDGWPYEGKYLDSDDNEMQGRYRLKTKPEVVHSEANAILKLARDGESGKGATLFCTHAPCIECAKLIAGAGITSVFYRDVYKNELGLDFLEKSGVATTRHPSVQEMDMLCGQ